MTIIREETIRDFEFWDEALKVTSKLTPKEWDAIEATLEAEYPDGMTATELNDLFWFHADWVFRLSRLDITEEELLKRVDE